MGNHVSAINDWYSNYGGDCFAVSTGRWYHARPSASSEDEDEDDDAAVDQTYLKSLAKDPRRMHVETALMKSDVWKQKSMSKFERPRLQRVISSPPFLGLIQATGGDPSMMAMLVDATTSAQSVALWRQKDAPLDLCSSTIEDQWVERLASDGVVDKLQSAAGGPQGLARQVLHQLSGHNLPRMTLDDALSQLDAALQPPGKQRTVEQPMLLPPFVLTQAALLLCPPRARLPEPPPEPGPRGRRRQPRHRQIAMAARKAATSSSTARPDKVELATVPSPHALLLDGWHFIIPCRWSDMEINPTLTHVIAATERLRAAAIIDTAVQAAATAQANDNPGQTGNSPSGIHEISSPSSLQTALQIQWGSTKQALDPLHKAAEPTPVHMPPPPPRQRQPQRQQPYGVKLKESIARGDFRPSLIGAPSIPVGGGSWGGPSDRAPPVVRLRDLYPGAVAPMSLLNKEVEVRPLRLAADWQPMLRPTRLREAFFFNPDAGRNAPELNPKWGLGPSMAAVDPLIPFDPNAPLLQAPLLNPDWVSLCKGLDKEPALRRARATVRVARRWAPTNKGRTPGRPVLFYITAQTGYDIRTVGKVRQSLKQFYKRGREVVSTLLKKHAFDTVFVYITAQHVATLDSWVLTHLKAKDLLLIQGSPGAVRAPVKPAPPWSAVPFAPHGRIDKVDAPEQPGKEHLLSGLDAHQPILRDAPALLRKF